MYTCIHDYILYVSFVSQIDCIGLDLRQSIKIALWVFIMLYSYISQISDFSGMLWIVVCAKPELWAIRGTYGENKITWKIVRKR